MPEVTITIPNEVLPRVKNAWEGKFTRKEGESDIDFFKRGLLDIVRTEVIRHESRVQRREKAKEDIGIGSPEGPPASQRPEDQV